MMKSSELIEILQRKIEDYGDCEVVGNREVSIVYDEEMDEYSECEVIGKIEDVKLSCSHSKHRIFVLC